MRVKAQVEIDGAYRDCSVELSWGRTFGGECGELYAESLDPILSFDFAIDPDARDCVTADGAGVEYKIPDSTRRLILPKIILWHLSELRRLTSE